MHKLCVGNLPPAPEKGFLDPVSPAATEWQISTWSRCISLRAALGPQEVQPAAHWSGREDLAEGRKKMMISHKLSLELMLPISGLI